MMTMVGPVFVSEEECGALQPQKPYPNGITVWRSSQWLGNGFGTRVRYVAVDPSGYVVGRYVSERYSVSAWVLGDPDLTPEYDGPAGRRYVVTTRLTRWRRAVKALRANGE